MIWNGTIVRRSRARLCIVIAIGSLACTLCLTLPSCRSAPISGRKQLLLVPESQELALGLQAYRETLATERVSQDPRGVELVRRVGNQIAQAAQRPDYQWEFNLIASPQQNAFCLPGGKVAVHEGILPICQNEAGLAVVMSHEIAHALARHGGERMSQGFLVNGANTALGYVTKGQEAARREQMMRVFGVTTKYGFVLPYSRKHESEADKIGIILMARAGYDPSEAPRFWQRFGTASGGTSMPEFLSTHPADARRAQELQAMLPVALAEYEKVPTKLGLGGPIGGGTTIASQTLPQPTAPTTPTAPQMASDPLGDPYAVPPQQSLLR